LYYKNEFQSPCLFSFPIAPTKIASSLNFFSNISANTRSYNVRPVLRQINPYMSNKWPLKFACAYLNTQRSCTTGTPVIRVQVLRHINAYVSNKWPLKFPCAYLNTQGSCTTGTPLIRIQGGIHSLFALLFNISLFWATRFSFIFGPF
ncbi:hypothetical protein T12_5262, partial [Trichinella patagoniensis]